MRCRLHAHVRGVWTRGQRIFLAARRWSVVLRSATLVMRSSERLIAFASIGREGRRKTQCEVRQGGKSRPKISMHKCRFFLDSLTRENYTFVSCFIWMKQRRCSTSIGSAGKRNQGKASKQWQHTQGTRSSRSLRCLIANVQACFARTTETVCCLHDETKMDC